MAIYVHVERWFYTERNGTQHFLNDVDEARKKVREGKPVFALSATGTLTPPHSEVPSEWEKVPSHGRY